MDTSPFFIDCMINSSFFVRALIDSGCLCFSAFSETFVRQRRLPRVEVPARRLRLAKDNPKEWEIHQITCAMIDIDGRREEVWGYIIPGLAYDMILGLPWMEKNDVVHLAKRRMIRFGTRRRGQVVRASGWDTTQPRADLNQLRLQPNNPQGAKLTIASVFIGLAKRYRRIRGAQICSASVSDITKALQSLQERSLSSREVREEIPTQIRHQTSLFTTENDQGLNALPPHRPGIDTKISLRKDSQGRDKEIPWGPLYSMSRDELLVLRKTLTDLLDKNWIRASNAPGGAPVLFARKPGGGLRFCVDYRGLNAITADDRYPLPLIRETLRMIARSKWLSKVDVRAAFHRLRIAEGDEWKTAFRTRYGAYEYLVTPFGLKGAPVAFQRWINSVLGDYLGDFCSAYLDDVIIFSDGSEADHWVKVNLILDRLRAAGLKLDLRKCAFASKEIKYLGFIVEVKKGIKVDPEKVRAVMTWEAPTNVRAVRSFLGFANFYRDFIPHFSALANPLTNLTVKGTPFVWKERQQRAFEELKTFFISAPVLAMWHEDRETLVEADSSGFNIGGCLSQKDPDDQLFHPIAYFSKRLTPAECNYDIHDKELLAIVRCLEAWRGELIGVHYPFQILTDHKNLQYFMTLRRLTERQVRWSQFLSQFSFRLQYRKGSASAAARPDALSRREQDMPSQDDIRYSERDFRLLRDEWLPTQETQISSSSTGALSPAGCQIFQDPEFITLWDRALAEDLSFRDIYQAVQAGDRTFPSSLQLRVSLSECSLDERSALLFRNRLWVPSYEPLCTALIQRTHDSYITGHPGRDSTLAILSRSFFWPRMSTDVRRFCRNCDVCGRAHVWRTQKAGFLLPLPIPHRFYSELSIDFVTDLPAAGSGPRHLMVITDRLLKSVTLEAMASMEAEACAERFLQCHYRFHGFPRAITSDRGSNWVGAFWRKLCELTRIEQRLSTSFHPQTDGSTERANQEVLTYLRAFVTYAQKDWPALLSTAMLAINNRNTSLGASPFFLSHGYHIEPVHQVPPSDPEETATPPATHARAFVDRIHRAQEFAAAAMAAAQQRMEEQANRHRQAAEQFRVGDLVWLSLRNITVPNQLKKKLAWLNAKYRVTRVISPHDVELDVPRSIHPRFHVDLIRRAAADPLPSQHCDDTQPPPLYDQEYTVDKILWARARRVGRGKRREVLVRWAGYAEPTWERRDALDETIALALFEQSFGTGDDVGDEAFKPRG